MNWLVSSVLSILVWTVLQVPTHSRVYELFHRDHYHDLLQDTPAGSRAPSFIAFYNDTSECQSSLKALDFTDAGKPSVDLALFGKYEMTTARQRVWYEYEDHLDLAEKLGVNAHIAANPTCECPLLVYVPVRYADAIEDDYLIDPSLDGVEFWDSNEESDWRRWMWSKLAVKLRISSRSPFNFRVTVVPALTNPMHTSRSHLTYDINAIESHKAIMAYVGDKVYVSGNPVDRKGSITDNTNTVARGVNPEVTPYIGMDTLFLEKGDEGKYMLVDSGNWDPRVRTDMVRRRHTTTGVTHTRNLVLPLSLPSRDPKGFIKRKMPDGLHDRLINFYRRFYHTRKAESWDDFGTQLNYFTVKSFMISLDNDFNERNDIAQNVIAPLLEEWMNDTDIQFTAFYGIREYERGASLRNHVDRVSTHVYSAILQIGQTDMDTPWPLEVIGFDGKRYRVTLKPGEMIFYEGHRLIHGRPEPLNGTLFTNAFCHFKPKGWKLGGSKLWTTPEADKVFGLLHTSYREMYA